MDDRQAADVLREISPARIFARPTAEDLWLGPTRESVLSHLSSPSPTRVLLGPPSSGRSSLLAAISARTSADAATLRIRGPQTDPARVLSALVRSAGLSTAGLAPGDVHALLSVYIAKQLGRRRRIVIEVDDADRLNDSAWKMIEELAAGSPAGKPELLLSLVHIDEHDSPAADYVRRESALSLGVLAWLEIHEVSQYLLWRLDRYDLAGIITPAAARLVARSSGGRFAAIDHICQIALLILRGRSEIELDIGIVREALRQIQRRRSTGRDVHPSNGWLIVTEAGRVIREVPLTEKTLIGRSESNDLYLESACLSRHHASIVRDGDSYFLNDLDSANGTWLNGQPIHNSSVTDGDLLTLGPYLIQVRLPGQRSQVDRQQVTGDLADTQKMPTPETPEPTRLKVIK